MDKEIVDQIEDVLTNHYEDDGHIYTKAELTDILNEIVDIVQTRNKK